MIVQDIIDIVKFKLINIGLAKHTDALIKFIYMGVSELYRRFNLSIKSETVVITSLTALYELRNYDVSLLLALYDKFGVELIQTDVYNGTNYDYKLLNYRSFLLRRPFDGYLYAVYKASPVLFKTVDDEVDLPEAMLEALIQYVTYIGHSTVNRQTGNETNIALQTIARFDAACSELEMQGYKIPLNSESLSIATKGYV